MKKNFFALVLVFVILASTTLGFAADDDVPKVYSTNLPSITNCTE